MISSVVLLYKSRSNLLADSLRSFELSWSLFGVYDLLELVS